MNSRSLILSTIAPAIAAVAVSGCALLPFGTADSAAPPAAPPAQAPAPASVEPTPVPPADSQPLSGPDAVVFANNALIVNVDERPDYRIEHVDGARHVSLGGLDAASASWKRSGKVLVTSRKTARARSAARLLIKNGFTDVAYLDGGHAEWTGAFGGKSPRDPQARSKLYFIHMGSETLPYFESYADQADTAITHRIGEDYKLLDRQFARSVDIEVVNLVKEPSRAAALLNEYKAPLATTEEDGLIYPIPCWILVDKSGRVQFLYGIPDYRTNLSRVYAWMVQETDREPGDEPLWAMQTP